MILRRFMEHIKDQNWFAVGLDVIVVIVGIFLGMQVTEWNDGRIQRDKEKVYLQEILISIKSDLQRFERAYYPRLEIKEQTIERLYDHILSKKQLTDDEFMKAYTNGFTTGIYYTGIGHDYHMFYDSGPYESLKSSGLQLVKNQMIRTKLIHHYENSLPGQTYFIRSSIEDNKSTIDALKDKLFKIDEIILSEGQPLDVYKPRVENILTNEEFWRILKLEGSKAWTQRFRLDGIKKASQDLVKSLEAEIATFN